MERTKVVQLPIQFTVSKGITIIFSSEERMDINSIFFTFTYNMSL